MTLLSLASKQIWPQVLTDAHLQEGQMRAGHRTQDSPQSES
jgi:hypothetical protein